MRLSEECSREEQRLKEDWDVSRISGSHWSWLHLGGEGQLSTESRRRSLRLSQGTQRWVRSGQAGEERWRSEPRPSGRPSAALGVEHGALDGAVSKASGPRASGQGADLQDGTFWACGDTGAAHGGVRTDPQGPGL